MPKYDGTPTRAEMKLRNREVHAAKRDLVAEARQKRREALVALPPLKLSTKSKYTKALGEEIAARVAAGETVRSITFDRHMPGYTTILDWVHLHPEFGVLYKAAQLKQAQYLAHMSTELGKAAILGDIDSDVARVAAQNFQWLAGRLDPAQYGKAEDRMNGAVTPTINVTLNKAP